MAKRFNHDKANQWIREHGTNSYLWWLNPHYCDEVPKDSELEEWNQVNLREWASRHNHIIRMFDRDKAEVWMYQNPGRPLVFNNPQFFTYSEKPTDYIGEKPLEELLEEINRQDFRNWRNELRHRVDNVVNVDGVAVSIFDSIEDDGAAVGEITIADTIRVKLHDKPDWAEVIIRIELDGYSIKDYAAELGKDPSGIGKMLKRAKEYLKKIW